MTLENIKLDTDYVRSKFPAFKDPLSKDWSFFENAGGSYVPKQVIEKLNNFMISTKVQPYAEYPMSKIAGKNMDEATELFAKIINAKELEESRKLLELEVDLGDETRTIFAGIKKSYSPDELIGKLVVVIANLKPRKMKFGTSNGMVLATQHDGEIIIIQPEKDVSPGSKIS